MKVKRFFAPDIRQAIRMVKMEQGPDAVILSNRKVEGGVEIITAVDYDESLFHQEVQAPVREKAYSTGAGRELPSGGTAQTPADPTPAAPVSPPPRVAANNVTWSQEPALIEMRQELKSLRSLLENQLSDLAWGDLAKNNPTHAELLQRLMKMGLSGTVCQQISGRLQRSDSMEELWQQALDMLSHNIKVTHNDILEHGGVVALIGPTGVGKTTTVAKLAARYAMQHNPRDVAMISADSFRVGAHDQLRRLGKILNIPVRTVANKDEMHAALGDFYDRDLVLIDTVGLGQRDQRIAEQVDMLKSDTSLIRPYVVLSATSRLSGMQEVLRAYRASEPYGCILTKLDEATSIGAGLSLLIQNNMPASYITDGQRIPEDMHPADAVNLVKRGVEIMNQHSPLLEDESLPLTLGRAYTDVHVEYKN